MRQAKKQVSLIDTKVNWNGSMFPFRGTAELYEEDDNISNNCMYEIDDDDEWMANSSGTVSHAVKLNNSLGSLISAYNSSDDSDNEAIVDVKKSNDNVQSVLSDDEPPVEVKIIKQPTTAQDSNENLSKTDATSFKSKRKRSKRQHTSSKKLKTRKVNHQNKRFLTTRLKKRNVTLLEKLLNNEIQHERNVLLQCVKYVVQNNFFLENKL